MLTAKQRRLHAYILARQESVGVAPSYEEMAEAMGLHSKSGVHRMVAALEERGWLRRMPNRARAIEAFAVPISSVAADVEGARAVVSAISDPSRLKEKGSYLAAARALEQLAWENGVFVAVRVEAVEPSSITKGLPEPVA